MSWSRIAKRVGSEDISQWDLLIIDILSLRFLFRGISFSHAKREANRVVHRLARNA